MGRPAVHVAHEQPELDVRLQCCDVLVGPVNIRHVVEHQQDAGDREDDEHEEGESTQAVGVRHLDMGALKTRRVQVKEDVRSHHQHLVAGGVGIARTEDRPPDVVMEQPIVEPVLNMLYPLPQVARLPRVFSYRHLTPPHRDHHAPNSTMIASEPKTANRTATNSIPSGTWRNRTSSGGIVDPSYLSPPKRGTLHRWFVALLAKAG